MRKILGWGLALSLLVGACTNGSASSARTELPTVASTQPRPTCGDGLASPCPNLVGPPFGGPLKVRLLSDVNYTLDPQKEYYKISWELYRCCLLRTLMSYPGTTTKEGGARVLPDLASAPPAVSTDGLTWTFHIKPNIHYSPPLQDDAVTAGDFIRALNREACSVCSANGYSGYYTVIRGFTAFRDREAKRISGLKAIDPLTLQIRLNQLAGDLPYRMSLAATAPIPPLPGHPDARFGIAAGHNQNDGRFALVGTGPYMITGTNKLDFDAPASEQKPVSGYVPGKSIVFMQNPSWDRSRDDLHLQNVTEMDFSIGGTEEDASGEVDSGRMDLCMDCPPIPVQLDPDLRLPPHRGRVEIHPDDALRYISMNVAQPPFDDIHVRRAINWAVDRNGMRQLRFGVIPAAIGSIAHHIFPDSLENNALLHYDPHRTPNDRGSIFKAQAEMRLSRYDHNHDGECDAPACKDVRMDTDEIDPYRKQAVLLAENLKPLGITISLLPETRGPRPPRCDPIVHAGLCGSAAWGKDYPDGFTYASPLFSSSSIATRYCEFCRPPPACCNLSLVGASPSLLERDGYNVRHVPNVDRMINNCERLLGDARMACWTDLDKFLMENVVPIVPLQFDNTVNVLAKRVGCYSFDQFAGEVALDHLCFTS